MKLQDLIQKLEAERRLTLQEFSYLIEHRSEEAANLLAQKALQTKRRIYGDSIYIRGLIEVTNFCKNNCYYCGIRRDNHNCSRYRLTREDILSCCKEGYELGFRTFVLQGGEDAYLTDAWLCELISEIKTQHPDCAVTLSLGERSTQSYEALFDAGADRYLLRHETADRMHYNLLHPANLSWENRMRCLQDLKRIGFQVGCGFMVGSPGQSTQHLAKDLLFVQEFAPHMCGIGPFIPHKDTEFANESAGSVELTCYLLSIVRLMYPNILLPATTALGTMHPYGREKGILSGANVIMPNLSPTAVRKKYMLYDNKASDGDESAQCIASLKKRVQAIGCEIVVDRGDIKMEKEKYDV